MDKSVYEVESTTEESHWWFVGRRRLFRKLMEEMHLPAELPIVDIGAGTGSGLRMLREMGFNRVVGIDQSDLAIEFCRSKGFGAVEKGDVCDLPFGDGSVGFILAADVIEHVDDDLAALREIRRVLARGGKAIITVPAFEILWGPQDDLSHHKRRYRKRQLLDRISEARLEVGEVFYFNYILFLPILLARKLLRFFKVTLESENELNSPAINWVARNIFGFDVVTARRLSPPFGVSLLAIVERQ